MADSFTLTDLKEAAERLAKAKSDITRILATLPPMAHSVLFTNKTSEEAKEVMDEARKYADMRIEHAAATNPKVLDDRAGLRATVEEVFLDGCVFATAWFQQKELARINTLMKDLN